MKNINNNLKAPSKIQAKEQFLKFNLIENKKIKKINILTSKK